MAAARRANAYAKVMRGSRRLPVPKKPGPPPPQPCGVCGKHGHASREHEPGGLFYVAPGKITRVPRSR